MKLIFGLGNPGKKYLFTRHNLGFLTIDHYLNDLGVSADKKKYNSFYAKTPVFGQNAIFVKPQTFMNRSGVAVAPFLRNFKSQPDDIIVIHDDVDIEEGKIRIKRGGGDGGQKGLRSIITETGGFADFLRIRIGIGRPPEQLEVSDYVLKKASKAFLKPMVDEACDALDVLLKEGYQAACNEFNR